MSHSIAPGRSTVAISAFNQVSIASLIRAAQQHADKIIVVDDDSTEQTARIAASAGTFAVVFRFYPNVAEIQTVSDSAVARLAASTLIPAAIALATSALWLIGVMHSMLRLVLRDNLGANERG